jgi:hypothetical protein
MIISPTSSSNETVKSLNLSGSHHVLSKDNYLLSTLVQMWPINRVYDLRQG